MFVCIYVCMYVCIYMIYIYVYPMYISTQATGNPRVRPLTFPVAPWPVRAVQVHRKDGSGASGRGLQRRPRPPPWWVYVVNTTILVGYPLVN